MMMSQYSFASGIKIKMDENQEQMLWLQSLDRIVNKMVEIIDKIENEFKKKKLGVLATYLCQILAKELEIKREEKDKVKRKKRMFPLIDTIPENGQDIYNKSMFGPHQELFSKEFFKLVKQNNVSRVLHRVQRNPQLTNDIDEKGRIPLHYACELGLLSMIEILLDFGSQILTCDNLYGHTPLDLAFKFQAANDFRDHSKKIINMLSQK